MNNIINMTTYAASEDQKNFGVIDLTQDENEKLRMLLRVTNTERKDLLNQANSIALFAEFLSVKYKTNKCLIGGKSFLIPFITKSMRDLDIETYMTNVKQVTTFVNGEILKRQRHCGVINCSI
ncbi:hypothetical protein FT666_15975 [Providencia rettgeri]|uniref:hypothetical protein n=1 Tax=Providencia rettgeri TaxID=587 RepID=UPI0011CC4D70|nr:hypothetical protein [Providencia rettgeri]TXM53772.1 hypothetical protein FT667_15595 [Providencia rettgeri]TXM77730.1 hypothetical protein FT666_15975 [Providencia rettgeri]